MPVTQDVLEHVQDIQEARKLLRLSEADHPTDLYLAIMHIESHGEELPDETDRYRYWFQIGQAYLDDARGWAQRHRPEQAAMMPSDFEDLYDAGPMVNAMVVMCYMQRYRDYHAFDPYRMAGMHKGGVGSAKQVTRKMRQGMSARDAQRWVSQHWIRAKTGRPWVPRLYLYVWGEHVDGTGSEHRFAQAFDDYSAWCDTHEKSSITPDAEPGVEITGAVSSSTVLDELVEGLAGRLWAALERRMQS